MDIDLIHSIPRYPEEPTGFLWVGAGLHRPSDCGVPQGMRCYMLFCETGLYQDFLAAMLPSQFIRLSLRLLFVQNGSEESIPTRFNTAHLRPFEFHYAMIADFLPTTKMPEKLGGNTDIWCALFRRAIAFCFSVQDSVLCIDPTTFGVFCKFQAKNN